MNITHSSQKNRHTYMKSKSVRYYKLSSFCEAYPWCTEPWLRTVCEGWQVTNGNPANPKLCNSCCNSAVSLERGSEVSLSFGQLFPWTTSIREKLKFPLALNLSDIGHLKIWDTELDPSDFLSKVAPRRVY